MYLNWSKFNMPYRERYIKNKVPTIPGIYMLYVQMENEKWDCFFVGDSENLHESMMAHLGEKNNPQLGENIKDYVCGFEYAPMDDDDERVAACKYLFDKLNPECMKDPGGTGIRVNIAKSW